MVCYQSNFRTLARYTPAAHCGRHAGQWPTRKECASAAHSKPLSRTTCHGAASAAAIPAIGSPPARHLAVQQALLQLSRRRPPCSMNKVAQSSLPRVLMVQQPFPVDNSPPCTIQVQQIVTNLISTGGAPQAQFGRCGGWAACLSGWLLHTGAAGSGHLSTLSSQECATLDLGGAASALAARAGQQALLRWFDRGLRRGL